MGNNAASSGNMTSRLSPTLFIVDVELSPMGMPILNYKAGNYGRNSGMHPLLSVQSIVTNTGNVLRGHVPEF